MRRGAITEPEEIPMSSARRPDRTAPSPLPSGPPPTGSGDTSPTGSGIVRGRLSFPADGQLTIVQFNDTQDCHRTDVRTTQLQRAVLEDVDPDVVGRASCREGGEGGGVAGGGEEKDADE